MCSVDQVAKSDGMVSTLSQAQAAQENDLNVLMVQFIVVAVRLLVEAAFNKDKGERGLNA